MDFTSALGGEAFRPFATVVAPGAIGLAPWAVLTYTASGSVHSFWDSHPVASGVALFIGSLAAGLVFENMGARVEQAIDDKLTREDASHEKDWRAYLLLVLDKEPIGQRYLRTILLRFKFEQAILGSLPAQLAGWLFLAWHRGAPIVSYAATALTALIVGYWFYREALDSARVLARLRKDLVAQFGTKTAT